MMMPGMLLLLLQLLSLLLLLSSLCVCSLARKSLRGKFEPNSQGHFFLHTHLLIVGVLCVVSAERGTSLQSCSLERNGTFDLHRMHLRELEDSSFLRGWISICSFRKGSVVATFFRKKFTGTFLARSLSLSISYTNTHELFIMPRSTTRVCARSSERELL